jgi:7,8-dihydropterin-6-yl-methyl-4-(beta-D-ribofuranosyl)aminobenzene 5'-phosphate synthase
MKGTIVLVCILLGLASVAPGEPTGAKTLRLTVVSDNLTLEDDLESAWGFACVVEGLDRTVMFDTGSDGKVLLANMSRLRISPGEVDGLVFSHFHGDHTRGADALLHRNPDLTVWVPETFPDSFRKDLASAGATVETVAEPETLFEGAGSTGVMGDEIPEQALVLQSAEGLVVITGCAHPGIVEIVRQAKRTWKQDVRLIVGGFHLRGMQDDQIRDTLSALRELGVRQVAPSHCTGDRAIEMFRKTWGEDFVESGSGAVIELPL